jgi:hypothetical protein
MYIYTHIYTCIYILHKNTHHTHTHTHRDMILKEAGSMAALEAMCSSADKTAASYAQAAIENLKISKKLRDSTLPQANKFFSSIFFLFFLQTFDSHAA